MRPGDAARRWADTWQWAWEALDTDAIVALYGTAAVLSTEPFREPYLGVDGVRSYVARVFGEEEHPRVSVGSPIVQGARAAVPWWASLTETGIATTLAGISLLRFDAEGLVVEQWDTWNVTEGQHDPPANFGPFRPSVR